MARYTDGRSGDDRYDEFDRVREEIVSVRDRIAHLTDEETADGISSVFELQRGMRAGS